MVTRIYERWEKLFKYRNVYVYDQGYSIKKLRERIQNVSRSDSYKFIRKGIDILIDEKKDFGNYVFIGKKSGIKIPVDYRVNEKDKNKVVLVIPTVLNVNQTIKMRDEIEILVELILNADTKEDIAEILYSIDKVGIIETIKNFTKDKTIIIDSKYDNGRGLPFQFIIEEGKIDKTWDEIIIEEL